MAARKSDPILTAGELDAVLSAEGPLPLVDIFRPKMDDWSIDHRRILEAIERGANGGKLFTSLTNPNRSGKDELVEFEYQVVEFVTFYGEVTNTPADRRNRVAADLVRATWIADHAPERWGDRDRAVEYVAEIIHNLGREAAAEDADGDSGDDGDDDTTTTSTAESTATPQDLSAVSRPGGRRVSQSKKDMRKSLLGK